MQFWFCQFCSGTFEVKDATSPMVENVNKNTEMISINQNVSNNSTAQELKIGHKTVLNYLHKTELKKKLDVWVPHQLAQKRKT